MNPRLKCPNCGLVNFANAKSCKRCRVGLPSANYQAEGTTLNININLPPTFQPQQSYPPRRRNEPPVERRSFEPEPQNFQSFGYAEPPPASPSIYDYQETPNQWRAPYPPNVRPPFAAALPPGEGMWRRGDELAIHRAASFPASCVKCGSHSAYSDVAYVKQKYRWHNPLVYIALISPLIYLVLSLCLSQTVSLNLPLCQKHYEARRMTLKFIIGGGVTAAILIFFSFSAGNAGFGLLLFLAALFGVVGSYEYAYKPARVSKIENDYVYLKGVDDSYLNQFPSYY